MGNMTIDTSREAVERILDGVTPGPWHVDGPLWNQIIWSSSDNRVCFMAHTNGLDDARDLATAAFIAAARELVPALLAERDAALAEVARLKADRDNGAKDYCTLMERHDALQVEVARLSTPPDDAEAAELGERLMNHGGMSWETSACYNGTREEAADALTRLSHALAAERKLADDLIGIVEGIDGAMNHGTWRDDHGTRLKDTPQWVAFYIAARRKE